MIVGIPKEVKDNEFRVAATPEGSASWCTPATGSLVEVGRGRSARRCRTIDSRARARRSLPDADAVFARRRHDPEGEGAPAAGIRALPRGPAPVHLPAPRGRRRAHAVPGERKVAAVAYETVQTPDGRLPLLAPMSEIAGRMAPHVGATLPGAAVRRPRRAHGRRRRACARLGSWCWARGWPGTNAAWIAAGMEAEVIVVDKNVDRLRFVDQIWRGRIQTRDVDPLAIEQLVLEADLVIGAVLVPGAKAPHLVTEEMVAAMRPGAGHRRHLDRPGRLRRDLAHDDALAIPPTSCTASCTTASGTCRAPCRAPRPTPSRTSRCPTRSTSRTAGLEDADARGPRARRSG